MAATGKALDWLREHVLAGTTDTGTLLSEAAAVPPGADGLIFLPYLAGERSPIWDPTARGAFVGLSLGHGRGHLTRAVLEAAALALRHVAAPIRVAGVELRELRVSGGAARSPLWNRIKADVLAAPVRIPEVAETALMGAAVLAAVGAGDEPDLETAMRRLVRFSEPITPGPLAMRTYDVAYEAYTALHPAISPIVGRLRTELADRPADEAWADAPSTAHPASRADAEPAIHATASGRPGGVGRRGAEELR
jgi:xylulokinase